PCAVFLNTGNGQPHMPTPGPGTLEHTGSFRSGNKLALCEYFFGDAESITRRRQAAIDCRVKQDLAQFIDGEAIVERADHMAAELARAVQRRQHGNVEDAAQLAIDAFAGPYPCEAHFFRIVVEDGVEGIALLVLG